MRIGKVSLYILCFVIVFSSCKKDDGGSDPVVVEVRDRAEQQETDNVLLLDYLDNHYYNSGEVLNNPDASISDIVITELLENETIPVDHTLLRTAVEDRDVVWR